ncbi:MAG: PPC domain-containing protein [Candidatus Eisenbacteria bacterium]|nr:PPC domain-containing protein [Candidatus Eisenbacteria bacterium]
MKRILVLAIGLAFAVPVLADPITGVEEKPWSYSIPFTSRGDVYEVEPNGSCATANPLACTDVMHAVISTGGTGGDWDYFQFTITTSGSFQFGTDADGTGSVGDTYIYLYNSSCVQIAFDDDSGPGLYSLITYNITTPGTYYGAVRSYSSSYTGKYKAFIVCPQPPPPNDRCEGAIEILCNTTINISGSTMSAINDYDPGVPGPSCTRFTAAGKDVTYKFTVPAGSVANLNYTSSADGSVYIVTDCSNVTGTCVIGEDSTYTGGLEDIENFALPGANTYYLILDNYGTGVGGTFTLTGMITCPTATEETSWGQVKTLYR